MGRRGRSKSPLGNEDAIRPRVEEAINAASRKKSAETSCAMLLEEWSRNFSKKYQEKKEGGNKLTPEDLQIESTCHLREKCYWDARVEQSLIGAVVLTHQYDTLCIDVESSRSEMAEVLDAWLRVLQAFFEGDS